MSKKKRKKRRLTEEQARNQMNYYKFIMDYQLRKAASQMKKDERKN